MRGESTMKKQRWKIKEARKSQEKDFSNGLKNLFKKYDKTLRNLSKK
jgi:hypothetical protein